MLSQHTSSTDPNVYENSTNSPGITVAGHVQPARGGSIDIFMSTSSSRVSKGDRAEAVWYNQRQRGNSE